MLAVHVEPGVLQEPDIGAHGLFGRRREEAVRPPALVQRAVHEILFVVEVEPRHAQLVGLPFDLPHAEIALHVIMADVGGQVERERVEVRRLGRPQGGIRDRENDWPAPVRDHGFGDDRFPGSEPRRQMVRERGASGAFPLRDADREFRVGSIAVRFDRDGDPFPVNVGHHMIALDVHARDAFQPHCLPNAGNARVETPVRIQ